MPRTIAERIALHEAGYLELRGPSGRLRGWYNPRTNELRFMDRKDTAPDCISLEPYQRGPVRCDGRRADDDDRSE